MFCSQEVARRLFQHPARGRCQGRPGPSAAQPGEYHAGHLPAVRTRVSAPRRGAPEHLGALNWTRNGPNGPEHGACNLLKNWWPGTDSFPARCLKTRKLLTLRSARKAKRARKAPRCYISATRGRGAVSCPGQRPCSRPLQFGASWRTWGASMGKGGQIPGGWHRRPAAQESACTREIRRGGDTALQGRKPKPAREKKRTGNPGKRAESSPFLVETLYGS